MGVTVNVDQRFLSHAQQGRCDSTIEISEIPLALETGPNSGSAPEACHESLNGNVHRSGAELRRLMEEGQGSNLLIDFPDRLLNILDDLRVPRIVIIMPEAREAEMQRHD